METLHQLRSEHNHIHHALLRFQTELTTFEQEGNADIEHMRDELAWMIRHPLEEHAHAESALCRALVGHEGETGRTAEAMLAGSEQVRQTAETLLEQLEDMTDDVVVPKDQFVALARRFMAECTDQLQREEAELYPLAESVLTDQEWQHLERSAVL